MGGLKKTAGRVHRSVSKVVDPLNIMDPGGVLPSSWAAGKKPFQFDKNYGKLQWNLGGSGGGGGGTSKSQYDPAMMMYFSQMQTQQAAQAEATRKAQEEALDEAKKQSASTTSQLAEQAAQQQISQDEATRKAKELEEQKAQQNIYANAGQSAIGGNFDINKARQDQLANIASGINLPFYNESSNTGASGTGRPANVFNLPKTTGIKFGGQ
jgi:hypothetical protein